MIKKITQTHFIYLDVSYASQNTFSKVIVTIFENYVYIYIINKRALEPRLRKKKIKSAAVRYYVYT